MPASEVAIYLGISKARVYQLIAAGQLPALKRGRRTLIPRVAFERWTEAKAQEATANLSERKEGTAIHE